MWYLLMTSEDLTPEQNVSSAAVKVIPCPVYFPHPQYPFQFLNVSILYFSADQLQFTILTVSEWAFK